MTPPLTPRDVATARGWEIGSVHRYLGRTRARLRHVPPLPLRPGDIPPPDASADGEPPLWLPDGPIAAWIARPKRTSRKAATP